MRTTSERLDTLAEKDLTLNKDGSLVELEPREWLVCFVPSINDQWWHSFVPSPFKHVFAMRKNGGGWTLFESWWTRLLVANIDEDKALKYLLWAYEGDVLLVKEAVPGSGSQLRGWMNCAGLVSYLLGRPYVVWRPSSLHRKLLAESAVARARMPQALRSRLDAMREEKASDASCENCRELSHRLGRPFCSHCGRFFPESENRSS